MDDGARPEVLEGAVALKEAEDRPVRTRRVYRDFELELQYLLPRPGAFNIAFRAPTAGRPSRAGIDLALTHGRPGTSGPRLHLAHAAAWDIPAPLGEWNWFRLRVVGNTINAWINGRQVLVDEPLDERGAAMGLAVKDRLTTGCIALGAGAGEVHLREVRLVDLSPDPDSGDWEWLISPDLAGWRKRGGGTWTYEDGALVGRDGPGHLFTFAHYDNFELRTSVKVNAGGNGGIYFRTVPREDDPDTWPLGFEAQVDHHDSKNFTGCIYDRAWPGERTEPVSRDGAWFDYRIVAEGGVVRTWINGEPMVNAMLTDFTRGYFALQTHHPGNEIMFRDMRVKRLGPAR